MCGIVGYIGEKNSVNFLIDGLKRLEYRGYDSAGLAVLGDNENNVEVIKKNGRLDELERAIQKESPQGKTGIGHTRWATHGKPSEANAHPHIDCKRKIALVHNGIIENFFTLREYLEKKGHIFTSQTDTEVLVHLIEENFNGSLVETVRKVTTLLGGSFAIAVICSLDPDLIVAARKDSPLVIGLGEGENFIASDIPALLQHTKNILILEDNEIAEVSRNGIRITTFDNKPIDRKVFEVKWDVEAAEKSGYEDFMLKEIYEQPTAIHNTILGRFKENNEIVLDELALSEKEINNFDKVFIVACGTSYHAGLVARQTIERWARLSVEIDIASEFRYRDTVIDNKTLVIAITQSGETSDTIAAVREAKRRGGRVIAVTNVVGSSITREADGVIYTHAGPEIGVAATKTLVSQIVALYILALWLTQTREQADSSIIRKIIEEIKSLPDKVKEVLLIAPHIKECAEKFVNCADFLFLGRGVGYPVALEGALKLKEISYIHAEGYAAGEMKHGPIALLDKDVPVVVVANYSSVYDKILSNILEAKARDAVIVAVATDGDENIKQFADYVFYVPETHELLSPIVTIVPLQLFAYYIAKKRGCDVDQPRNLAKSVTVE
ncbi:MAG: glutamine--fructose-6-phosphate transaminase (isomerizing) [Actinobacteria bacterium]|nr:glutamine--fructose-6-phosphate transaminase (isomerizing) [Actinomycetota bacterium]